MGKLSNSFVFLDGEYSDLKEIGPFAFSSRDANDAKNMDCIAEQIVAEYRWGC